MGTLWMLGAQGRSSKRMHEGCTHFVHVFEVRTRVGGVEGLVFYCCACVWFVRSTSRRVWYMYTNLFSPSGFMLLNIGR